MTMEKRNVATAARVKDSDSAENAIKTAAACIGKAQGIMKKAKEAADGMRISMESMKRAMEEDEKADRE